MKTLTIELPDDLSAQAEHDLKMEMAGALYAKGLLSTGQAAQLVGISRREFIETMGRYKISIFTESSIDHLTEDVANARRYLRH
jgi:predicted HTH domain antitoxin